MLLKFKITETFQHNDWSNTNINEMDWPRIPYDVTDGQNKFYFFRYVTIDNSSDAIESRYFPLFIRNYKFAEQAKEYADYILKNKQEFLDHRLIPVVLDPLEGFAETTAAFETLAEQLKPVCKVYMLSGNNLLAESKNSFEFYSTNHWIHHLKDSPSRLTKLNPNHKIYISLNRMAREHRVMLTQTLIKNGLREFGYITWANGRNHKHIDFSEGVSEIANATFDILDIPDILEKNPTMNLPLTHCDDTFLFLVTETHVCTASLFLSEKTFKPIMLGMPFINLGNPGTLRILKKLGFKTFSTWINEDYDLDLPIQERCDIIASEIQRFSLMTDDDRFKIRQEMSSILIHNKKTLESQMNRSDLVESLIDIGKRIYKERKLNL